MSNSQARTSALAVAALGVVYGDIGTSPLYTMHEVFAGAHHAVPITHDNVFGILSLIFWSLIIVVSLKYVAFIMRADNKGEGGIMALMALVLGSVKNGRRSRVLMLMGLFGAALFYGDGVITPAISVLSAVEGLEVAAPALKHWVIPITLAVLMLLFLFQRHGTGQVGKLFGPVMCLWFATLALLGVVNIIAVPEVLGALNPYYALVFLTADPGLAFFSLGAVVLALTGAEALYADMGHFGRHPVQLAWFSLVLPSLVLNYFGQGALLLDRVDAVDNPFYLLAPTWALYPLVALSTVATVIASQAVISGAFSITSQAMRLGYLPRVEILHTSKDEMGQIYLPGINRMLLVCVAALVLGFGSSTNLAAAYGIAVTGTMTITSMLAYVVARTLWGWSRYAAVTLLGGFLIVDVAYLAANMTKITEGGWFPLVFGAGIFVLLTTWKRGRQLLSTRLNEDGMPLDGFVKSVAMSSIPTVHGTAIFMTTNPDATPHSLLHSLKHYKCLHERMVILTAIGLEIPHVAENQRVCVERINDQFWKVKVFFGFMDTPDLPEALDWCAEQGLDINFMETSFFLGRETLIPKLKSDMAFWREKLFIAMFRNAGSAAAYFHLPPGRVVELGTQVVL